MGQSHKIVIIGGVAGGMSCATRLRRLNESAQVTVIEKGPFISYANCGIPYTLGGVIDSEDKLHVMTPAKLNSWFNIDVRTHTTLLNINSLDKTVTVHTQSSPPDAVEILSYDKLVLALGAESSRPPIKGIEAPHVFTLQTIPQLRKVQALISQTAKHQHAAVIGGGFIGLEVTENLVRQGLGVTLLEALPHVMPPVDPDIAEPIHKELRLNGVYLYLNARIVEIVAPSKERQGSIILEDSKDEYIVVPADLVIVATGVRPRTIIAEHAGLQLDNCAVWVNRHMQTSDPNIYAVGDMVATLNLVLGSDMNLALAGPASRQGRIAAEHICGRQSQYRGNVSTSVCKVFDQAIGSVGFSTEALLRMGNKGFQYVTVHPPDHAAYYPDAKPMTLRVVFEVPGGRLLGAQVVGPNGVDKRIDVLAMAIRAGMTVEDLEHVELAYAPPYGSAKDPVNMAGFVGGNTLRGDVQILHPADLASMTVEANDFQLVDVRSVGEFKAGHMEGAFNIPIDELRARFGELNKDRDILVYCWVGYRGYLAARILEQKGFRVFNLDGGFKNVWEGGYSGLCATRTD